MGGRLLLAAVGEELGKGEWVELDSRGFASAIDKRWSDSRWIIAQVSTSISKLWQSVRFMWLATRRRSSVFFKTWAAAIPFPLINQLFDKPA